jgi:hypothetical protein
VAVERWFYRNAAEWLALADRLKLTPCPHCRVVGALNRHGFLYGFDDSSPRRKTVRARRIFCSNRCARRGCGRTKRLHADDLRDFLLRQLDRVGLPHNSFTRPAIDLIVRSADGVLRKARNLCVGCLIEAVRSASKTIDIDNVNRVLLQPHWQKDTDLVDY